MRLLDFKPSWGMESSHIQTITAGYAQGGAEPPSIPYYVDIGRGDKLACLVSLPPDWDKEIIVMLHGLGGHQSSSYMVRLSRKLYAIKKMAVRMNMRGCGLGENLSSLPYNSGNSADLFELLLKLKKDYPDSPISVVGFSLGGNLLLKLLGERGELMKETVTQAIAICPPIDLFFTCEAMNEGFNKIYQRYYINNLTKQSSQWIGSKRINTVYEYDEKVTAPFWGYANAIDYYYKCSSLRLLPQIRVPTHILFSADDPFIDYKPALNHENEFISIGLSEKGGHMGFYGGGGDNFWMDTLVLNWLKGDYTSNNL